MATIYVSKSGNDSNNGTSEGTAKLTIGAAITLVNTLVGMGATILDGAVVGNQCIIGANALVKQGYEIPDGSMVLGSPARVVRKLSDEERTGLKNWADKYVANAAYCMKHGINVGRPLGY